MSRSHFSVLSGLFYFGSLKVALWAYTFFLSDTAFAGTAREGNGHVGGTAFYAAPEGNSNSNIG